MTMMRTATGSPRLRVRPWQADARVAHIAPVVDCLGPLSADDVDATVTHLRDRGYRAIVTAALHRADRQPFADVGFVETERLHLLLHGLGHVAAASAAPGIALRRGRRRELGEVLAVDHAAFAPFWRLDGAGLDEALSATATVHFQTARDHSGIVGYAVCGRAGHRGYVQRLAVHPSSQGRGAGAVLLADGLRWLRRWGAHDALVNTQERNTRSLRLYRRAGFVLQPEGLAVLQLTLDGPPSAPPREPRSRSDPAGGRR